MNLIDEDPKPKAYICRIHGEVVEVLSLIFPEDGEPTLVCMRCYRDFLKENLYYGTRLTPVDPTDN